MEKETGCIQVRTIIPSRGEIPCPIFNLVFAGVVLTLGLSGVACAEGRFALLIGNQIYLGDVGNLKNPAKDVKLVGDSLRKIGFDDKDIVTVVNGGRNDILPAIRSCEKTRRRRHRSCWIFKFWDNAKLLKQLILL
jgi:hypothetical protein